MNEKISNFINEQKRIQKEKHLISLGLVEAEMTKVYAPITWSDSESVSYGYNQQDENGWYKMAESPIPIDVTDEEYNELCKVCPPKAYYPDEKTDKVSTKGGSAEMTLSFFAWFQLVLGIIAAIILIIMSVDNESGVFFGIGIGVLFSSLITWAVSLVFVNISRQLTQLNSKI